MDRQGDVVMTIIYIQYTYVLLVISYKLAPIGSYTIVIHYGMSCRYQMAYGVVILQNKENTMVQVSSQPLVF